MAESGLELESSTGNVVGNTYQEQLGSGKLESRHLLLRHLLAALPAICGVRGWLVRLF